MPKRVQYRTKIVDISRVELEGQITLKDDWFVGTDNLEEWIDKFDGKRVRVTIELLDKSDDSHLLPSET